MHAGWLLTEAITLAETNEDRDRESVVPVKPAPAVCMVDGS